MKIAYYLLLLGCFSLIACDDYLDIKPKGTLIPTTFDEYSKILDYEYNLRFADGDVDIYSDDVYLYGTVHDSWVSQVGRRAYKWEPTIYFSGDRDGSWSGAYSRIFNFNLIIKEIDGAQGATAQQKQTLKGEAHLARAFEYLRLLQKYGKPYDPETSASDPAIPLRLEPIVAPEVLTRASVAVALEQVKTDLEIALSAQLPDTGIPTHRGSKVAIHGVLARMHLYMRDYEAVYTAANTAITLIGEPLPMEDYNDYQVVNATTGRGRTDLPDGDLNKETVYLKLGEQGVPSGYVFISDGLKALYENGDKRFELFFANPYRGVTYDTEMFARHLVINMGISTAELLLMRAEAAARANNLSQALNDLNTLRRKRLTPAAYGTGLSSTNQQEVIQWVLDERRRELCFLGGSRFFDMKRLSKDPQFTTPTVTRVVDGETYTLAPGSPRYAFPIWVMILESNPGMPQN